MDQLEVSFHSLEIDKNNYQFKPFHYIIFAGDTHSIVIIDEVEEREKQTSLCS